MLVADQNLISYTVNRDNYIKATLDQHLSNDKVREIITKNQSQGLVDEALHKFLDNITGNSVNKKYQRYEIKKSNVECIMRYLSYVTRMVVCYGMTNVNKGK